MDSSPVSKNSSRYAALQVGHQQLEKRLSAQFQKMNDSLATLTNAAKTHPAKTHPNSPESSTTTSTTASTQLLAEIQKALKTSTNLDQRFDKWKTATNKYTWKGDIDILASERLATFYLIELDNAILALQLKQGDYQQQIKSLQNQHYRFDPQHLVEKYLPYPHYLRKHTTFPSAVPDLLDLLATTSEPYIQSLTARTQALQYQVEKINKQIAHFNSLLDKLYSYLPNDILSALATNPSETSTIPATSFHEPTSILPIVSYVSPKPPKPPLRISELASTTSNTSPTSTASSHLPPQSSATTLTHTNILQHCYQLPISSNQQRNYSDTSSDWSYPSSKSSHQSRQSRKSCICPSCDQPCLCPSPPSSVHSSYSSY